MSEPREVTFTLNGAPASVRVHPMARLLDVLREERGLTGTKEGCGEGECGACAVLVDGALVNSCLVPALQIEGAEVTTIEALEQDGALDRLQRAFVEHGGAQCGICTPGMILAGRALLAENPAPSEAEIRAAIAGNLCRCTGYVRIVDAIAEAGRLGREEASR